MAKNMFRFNEFNNQLTQLVEIKPPIPPASLLPEADEIEEYTGPTADDLRREAEEFRTQWEEEKAIMIQEAQLKAEQIIQEAEQTAHEKIRKETAQAQKIKIDAEKEKEALLKETDEEARKRLEEAQRQVAEIQAQSRQAGFKEGYEEGWQEGKVEAERLVERIHVIINKLIEKRSEIIDETETQIIQLILLIVHKVVKVISENQKNVVVNNVLQALRKIRTRGDVVVRVNLADLKVASDHVKELIQKVENVKSITVLEDSTVDPGGCLVETDFGQIDGRIASQLNEIEEKIRELMPMRTKVAGEQKSLV